MATSCKAFTSTDATIVSQHRRTGLTRADLLWLVFGLTIFGIITFWKITAASIWFDEAFSAYLIRFDFMDIAHYTAADVHPPLYYWALKLWSMLFGTTELSLRSMSALFSLVAITFGYLLVCRLFDKKSARISLIFMVFSPMLVRYGQEARMYAMVAALALVATYVLTVAVGTKKKSLWVLYGTLLGLGMWTHYFFALIWVSHLVWHLSNTCRATKRKGFLKTAFSKEWVTAYAIAIILFIPWVPCVFTQMSEVQISGFWIPDVTPSTIIDFFTNALLYQDASEITGLPAAVFVLVAIAMVALAIRAYRLHGEPWRRSYRLIISLAFFPVLLLFFASTAATESLFVDRYLIASALSLSLFMGITLAESTCFAGKTKQVGATLFIAALLIAGICNVWQLGNYNKNTDESSNARGVIEAIAASSEDGQPIITATSWFFYEAAYYSTNTHPVYFIDEVEYTYGSLAMLEENNQYKITDITSFTQANPVFWYIGEIDSEGLDTPYSNWNALQTITIYDSVTGEPAYEAIQYEIVESQAS